MLTIEGAYHALLEFDYEGQTISMRSFMGFKREKYPIGTELEVLYIPGETKGVMIKKDGSDLVILGIGVIALILFGISYLLN